MYLSRFADDGRGQLTTQHLEETAQYASMLGKKLNLSAMTSVAALLHDIGKYSGKFVEYLLHANQCKKVGEKVPPRGHVIHSTQGAKYVCELGDLGTDRLLTEIIAICIAGHHGGLMDGMSPVGDTPLRDRLTSDEKEIYYDEVRAVFEEECSFTGELGDLLHSCRDELSTFLKLCKEKKLNAPFMIQMLVRSVFSCLVDSDRYNAYCFETKEIPEACQFIPPWEKYALRLEQAIAVFPSDTEIARIRHDISDRCLRASERPKGIYRLDVPTGGGKTLSSLRFALNHAKKYNMGHIIYIIPYLSVLEQASSEIKDALKYHESENFILEHHSNIAPSDDEHEAKANRLLTDRWDSPIIITTMVQFLESIYSDKSGDLRKFHNMSNAVFIFDEVQSLPIKCLHLFNEAINYLYHFAGCSVLLCTATQPPFDKAERPIHLSSSSALISDVSAGLRNLKRTYIKDSTIHGGYSTEKLQQFVLDKYNEDKNCLVILNRKRDAINLYRSIENNMESSPRMKVHLIHLSTYMCPAHRLDVINAMKNKGLNNTLCISTQLIEAGVNISFACVIRAIAGLDSIAQAAGRCNRNGEYSGGKNVYVVNIAGEDLSYLQDIKIGSDITHRILSTDEPEDLLSSATMQRYYEDYFFKQMSKMDYPVGDMGYLYDLLSSNKKGRGAYLNRGGVKCPGLMQAFRTAGDSFSVIEQRTTSVLVPYGKGAELAKAYSKADLKYKGALLHQIGRYSVSLYPHEIKKLHELRALTMLDEGILMLDARYYSDKLGVILDDNVVWGQGYYV